MEAAFKEAIKAEREKRGIAVPDLLKDGPAGEYEELSGVQ
jgi:hypothetical protein